MSDSMRGLFFIVKGQYARGVEPSFMNTAKNEVSHIGGYNPYSKETHNWYMLLDCKTFHCIACGSDFNKVVKGVYTVIKRYKGDAKKYFKHISDTTSDDYYETHYLGRTPLTPEQRANKAEGKCPRVSPVTRCVYERVYEEYGDYYSDEIEEMEDLAYSELKEEKPIHKTKKLMAKTKTHKKLVKTTPKEETVTEVTTPMKKVKPKVKLGVKKLSLG